MTGPDPYALDPRAVARSFDRASATFEAHAALHAHVRDELLRRLDLLGFAPAAVLDLGAGTGVATRALRDRWPKARVVALDRAPAMLAAARGRQGLFRRFDRVRADATRLPFRDGAFDFVWASLVLPWLDDLDAALAEVRRVLAPRGCFTFATLGPDTLVELRGAWAAADGHVHVNRFLDMHDVGDALVRAGFGDPVMDVDRVTLTYPDVGALMRELRALGARNLNAGRPRGLTGRARLARVEAAYARHRREDGRVPATAEVVYGQAWRPGTEAPVRGRRGEVAIDLGNIGRRRR